MRAHAEWSETHGTVSFGWGHCTLDATPDTLTLRAEAPDQDDMQRVQDLLAEHLERFASRDGLKVDWQPG